MTAAKLGSEVMADLAKDLHRMGPAGRKALQRTFAAAAQPALAAARAKASWSSRIPGAISVRATVSDAQARYGVELRTSAAAAPHARPYEGITGARTFRHPVYGNREKWVPVNTRPYVAPAVQAQSSIVAAGCAAAFDNAARECGFH